MINEPDPTWIELTGEIARWLWRTGVLLRALLRWPGRHSGQGISNGFQPIRLITLRRLPSVLLVSAGRDYCSGLGSA